MRFWLAGIFRDSKFLVWHSVACFSLVGGAVDCLAFARILFSITADRVGLSIVCLCEYTCVSPFVDEHKKSDTKSTVQVLYQKERRSNPRS